MPMSARVCWKVCLACRLPGTAHLLPQLQLLSKAATYIAEVHGHLTSVQDSVLGPQQHARQEDVHPVRLPPCNVDLKSFPKKYSLPIKLQGLDPLHTQMVQFSSWMKSPIQLDRNGGPCASRTVDNITKNVYLFMGYLHRGHCLEEFTLHHFLDLDLYAAYISFQLAKGNGRVNLAQQLSNSRKVMGFLKRRADPRLALTISSCEIWVSRLGKQIPTILPSVNKDIGQLQEDGGWMNADQVVAMFEKLRQGALAGMSVEGGGRMHACMTLHDACLASCMFGYLPPVRLSCLRSLQMPGQETCLHKDCINSVGHLSCGGNRLEWVNGVLCMILPHHKLQVRWNQAAIKVKLPKELQDLLLLYLDQGHRLISPQSPFVFSDSKGKPMLAATSMTNWFQQLLKRLGAPASFPPNRLRHIWVDERLSLDRAEGPEDKHACMVMGNSIQAWQKHYDLSYNIRNSQQGVDRTAVWRRAMLDRSAQGEDVVVDVD